MAASGTAPLALVLNNSDPGWSTAAGLVDSSGTPSSRQALARYEFEMGRGSEGTKVLMVEWVPTPGGKSSNRALEGAEGKHGWRVHWSAQGEQEQRLSISETDDEEDVNATQRMFFFLGTEAQIPPVVTIYHSATGWTLHAKSMPGIYTPSLGVGVQNQLGKRGVLHTIWAKKRLSELQIEIAEGMQRNTEDVGVEMAMQEQQWILEHFGLEDAIIPRRSPPEYTQPTFQSARSPVGGRLGEKLRGLKLATSPADLANNGGRMHNSQQSILAASSNEVVRLHPISTSMAGGQVDLGPSSSSLDAIVKGESPNHGAAHGNETEDELFALPMSPRSPEMKKSPFSLL